MRDILEPSQGVQYQEDIVSDSGHQKSIKIGGLTYASSPTKMRREDFMQRQRE